VTESQTLSDRRQRPGQVPATLGRAAAAIALAGAAFVAPARAAPATAQTAPVASAPSWLDQAALPGWNTPNATVPAPPSPPAGATPPAPCTRAERAPETPEDGQVAGAGWRLFREAQSAGPVRVVWGLSGYDGMCRPMGYQAFAFAHGAFAGTFSPRPMDSRADASLQGLSFVAPSASAGALATLSGVFSRFEPGDPACCPASQTTAGYQVLVPDPGRSSVLVATRAVTSPSAPVRPGPAPDASATAAPGTYTARFQDISFTFSLSLAPWVEWQVVPATPVQPEPGLGGAAPRHVLFSFVESRHDPAAPLMDTRHPQLRVLPVAGLRALDPSVAASVDSLHTILTSRPAALDGPLPVFPPLPANQQLRARMHYLDFPGGSGVACLTRYAVDASPVVNDSLAYTFQGLSSDGQHYVSFFWPVDSAALPDTHQAGLAGQTYDAFAAQFEAYLARTTQALDAQPDGAFTPALWLLDGLLGTLRIGQ
jgi:hypothetical protein